MYRCFGESFNEWFDTLESGERKIFMSMFFGSFRTTISRSYIHSCPFLPCRHVRPLLSLNHVLLACPRFEIIYQKKGFLSPLDYYSRLSQLTCARDYGCLFQELNFIFGEIRNATRSISAWFIWIRRVSVDMNFFLKSDDRSHDQRFHEMWNASTHCLLMHSCILVDACPKVPKISLCAIIVLNSKNARDWMSVFLLYLSSKRYKSRTTYLFYFCWNYDSPF